jgi:hypothetical protein
MYKCKIIFLDYVDYGRSFSDLFGLTINFCVSFFETGSQQVALVGLELGIFLLLSLECWE